MKDTKWLWIIGLVLVGVLMIDYFGYVNLFSMMSVSDDKGMPNPASVYCEANGGKLDLTNGLCMFEDGSQCPEWEFFRGTCKPGGPEPQKCLTQKDCLTNTCFARCVGEVCQTMPVPIVDKFCGSSLAMCLTDPCMKWVGFPACEWDTSECNKDPECETHDDCKVEKSCFQRLMCVDGKCVEGIMYEIQVPPRPCAKFIGYPDCKWDYSDCGKVCPEDVKECPDGSFVSRDPKNDCQFPKCPVIDDDIKDILDDIKKEQIKQTSLLQRILDFIIRLFGGK